MNPLSLGNYLKAVIGAVGANVFPPLADWVTSYSDLGPTERALGALDPAGVAGDGWCGILDAEQDAAGQADIGEPHWITEGAIGNNAFREGQKR